MTLISIIIPVYNAEAFIAKALDSCLQQRFSDFEIVAVDDGSKDNSLSILKEYAARDKRVRVFSGANVGVVVARETGVRESQGEFLLFMDADDLLPEGVLQILVNAIKPDVDMVIGDINQIEVDGSSSIIKYGNRDCVTGKEHFGWIVREHVGFLWGKLIRKPIVTNIKVIPYRVKFCEDYLQMLQISYNAHKVVHVNTVSYNYIQQDGSACNKELPVKEYAQRFADLCLKLSEIIDTCGYDNESNIKLKVLFLYYCRLYLCSNGRWKPNRELKIVFKSYLKDIQVVDYFKSTDNRRYKTTKMIVWLYPIISIIYRFQLKKSGRIR